MQHPKQERTLVIVKPDGIQRSLVGEIVGRFERIGLKIVAAKMVVATPEHVEAHYTLDPNWRRVTGEKTIKAYTDKGEKHPVSQDPLEVTAVILKKLKKYMTNGPVIPMVLEGAHAVAIVRKLIGSTEPLSSDVGTIRGDFVLDSYAMSYADDRSVRNLVHASGSVGEAEQEIRHWFAKDEIVDYKHIQEEVLYG
ncbi:MAG TPA: nucleoside-diphosphate kinase [Candidatus Paceibacterota bacterium]|nr:nucleoside-diphosphate kinase [Candidatus Paceibacterota bacterium]